MSAAPFVPANPEFESVVRESFSRQTMMATLGAGITRLRPGEVDLRLPWSPAFCQQNGYMHAGAIASVADSANGYAAFTLAAPDTDVLAVEFKINLLAPARGTEFLACGRVLRPGRTLTDADCNHAVHPHRAAKSAALSREARPGPRRQRQPSAPGPNPMGRLPIRSPPTIAPAGAG